MDHMTLQDPSATNDSTGMYLYVAGRIYKVEALSEDRTSLRVRIDGTDKVEDLPLSELFAPNSGYTFASSLSELASAIATAVGRGDVVPQTSEDRLLVEARRRIAIVEVAGKLLDQARLEAFKKGVKFKKVEALQTKILPNLTPPVCLSDYYKFRTQYNRSKGNEKALAAMLHRSTYGKTKLDAATFHFVHTVIMQFWGRGSKLKPGEIHETAKKILEHTKGMWLDPTKSASPLPDNILAQLVDEEFPIGTLLNHPENKVLLSPIKLPEIGWFRKYLGYYTQAPDNVHDLFIQRFGREKFEQEYLIFNSFVHKATAPLQSVVWTIISLTYLLLTKKHVQTPIDYGLLRLLMHILAVLSDFLCLVRILTLRLSNQHYSMRFTQSRALPTSG